MIVKRDTRKVEKDKGRSEANKELDKLKENGRESLERKGEGNQTKEEGTA